MKHTIDIKQQYVSPTIQVIDLELENTIAGSLRMKEDQPEINGPARSKRSFWDNE